MFAAVAGLSPALFNPGGMSGSWMGSTPSGELDQWYPRTFGESFDAKIYSEATPFAYVVALGELDAPPAVMLIVGDDDYFELYDGTAEMFLALRAVGLKPEFRVGDGGHDWSFWRGMEAEAFRFLDTALAPAQ
jgi:S-formylglutathione hydrolase FrmB